jgi:hypothetical protein
MTSALYVAAGGYDAAAAQAYALDALQYERHPAPRLRARRDAVRIVRWRSTVSTVSPSGHSRPTRNFEPHEIISAWRFRAAFILSEAIELVEKGLA